MRAIIHTDISLYFPIPEKFQLSYSHGLSEIATVFFKKLRYDTLMITKDDIANLAHLARIEVPEGDMEKLARDMDGILGYVGEVSVAVKESRAGLGEEKDSEGGEKVGVQVGLLKNVFREDVPDHEKGEYTEAILANAPAREGNFIKVQKIL